MREEDKAIILVINGNSNMELSVAVKFLERGVNVPPQTTFFFYSKPHSYADITWFTT